MAAVGGLDGAGKTATGEGDVTVEGKLAVAAILYSRRTRGRHGGGVVVGEGIGRGEFLSQARCLRASACGVRWGERGERLGSGGVV